MEKLKCEIISMKQESEYDYRIEYIVTDKDGEIVSNGISSSVSWVIHDAGGYHTKKKFDELYSEGNWVVDFSDMYSKLEFIDNDEKTIKRIQELVPDLGERYKDSIYIVVREGAGKDSYVSVCDFIDENIIHVPITLAVVLLALTINKEYTMTFAEAEKENMGHDWENIMYCFRDMNWNLSKDNFDDQSEDTKTFIGNLLNNK